MFKEDIEMIRTPLKSALAGDICISEKFGATAALEAALYGRRAILLDKYPLKTDWDSIYDSCDIVYPSLNSALFSINRFFQGHPKASNLGDWSPILKYFNSDSPTDPRERLAGSYRRKHVLIYCRVLLSGILNGCNS